MANTSLKFTPSPLHFYFGDAPQNISFNDVKRRLAEQPHRGKRRRTHDSVTHRAYHASVRQAFPGNDEDQLFGLWSLHVHSRYKKLTQIGSVSGSVPQSYRYLYQSDELPPNGNFFPVEIHTELKDHPTMFAVPHQYKDFWLVLNEKYKHRLLTVLQAVGVIWERISFDNDRGRWISDKKTPPSANEKPSYSVEDIKYYGEKQPEGNDVCDILSCGKTERELASIMSDIHLELGLETCLAQLWVIALSNQTSGITKKAIDATLTIILGLRYGLPFKCPLVTCVQSSSSSTDNASSMSIDSSPDARSDRAKRTIKEEIPTRYMPENEKTQDDGTEPNEENRTYPHHDADLMVLSLQNNNEAPGVGIYVFLIEILSHGKTDEEAHGKFLTKLIHVLQGQNEVFGLFFARDYVMLYRAVLLSSQKVGMFSKSYLLKDDLQGNADLLVSKFQELWMDIFTCLIYGMFKIVA